MTVKNIGVFIACSDGCNQKWCSPSVALVLHIFIIKKTLLLMNCLFFYQWIVIRTEKYNHVVIHKLLYTARSLGLGLLNFNTFASFNKDKRHPIDSIVNSIPSLIVMRYR